MYLVTQNRHTNSFVERFQVFHDDGIGDRRAQVPKVFDGRQIAHGPPGDVLKINLLYGD